MVISGLGLNLLMATGFSTLAVPPSAWSTPSETAEITAGVCYVVLSQMTRLRESIVNVPKVPASDTPWRSDMPQRCILPLVEFVNP